MAEKDFDEIKSSFESVETDKEYGELLEQQSEFIEIPTPDFDTTYQHIKSLIYDGFIPVTVGIVDFPVVMKALNPNEFRYIELLGTSDTDKVALYFLYSMVLFDGETVIPFRKEMHRDIIELFRTIPTQGLNRFTSIINAIHRYYAACYDDLEAYLYENEPRFRWLIYQKRALNTTLLNGFDDLGWNTAQEVWISFNQREDRRELDDREFANAKFIASAMVGDKEIRKINLKEELRWKEELKRRQDVRLKKKMDRLVLTAPTHTAEELVESMMRQIRGEKDLHDRIIEEYEQRLLRLAEKRRRDFEDMRLRSDAAILEHGKMSGGRKRVTKEEMEEEVRQTKSRKRVGRRDDATHYLEKLSQTSQVPQSPQVKTPDGQKSIFDPDVQNALKKLKER